VPIALRRGDLLSQSVLGCERCRRRASAPLSQTGTPDALDSLSARTVARARTYWPMPSPMRPEWPERGRRRRPLRNQGARMSLGEVADLAGYLLIIFATERNAIDRMVA